MSGPLRRLAGNRNVLLAYAGAAVLFGVTSAFSHGFASENHIRILLIQASFIGLVALGQSFVILGGGIDLSVPWTLNGAAVAAQPVHLEDRWCRTAVLRLDVVGKKAHHRGCRQDDGG